MQTIRLPDSIQDDPEAFKALIARPQIAWPTVGLFLVALSLYVTGVVMGVSGRWPTWLAVAANALSAYWMFTVAHDAAHNSLSLHRWLNEGLGRIATLTLLPLPIFRAFRYIHMQHHRFSNEADDPDYWVGKGSVWALPLRAAVMDLHYIAWYLPRLSSRPKGEIRETLVSVVLGIGFLAWLIAQGWGMEVLLYWLLPARMAVAFLAFAFDYLPHSPYKATEAENKYIATSVRAGAEWLLTPLLLGQNYHLVHHLYPLVPFYRYVRVWRARERFHLSKEPLMVSVASRELSANDYLATRGRV